MSSDHVRVPESLTGDQLIIRDFLMSNRNRSNYTDISFTDCVHFILILNTTRIYECCWS
jgi:hypothetical protein